MAPFLAGVLLCAILAFYGLTLTDRWRLVAYWHPKWWECSARRCRSASITRCRNPIYHETMETLGHACTECEPSRVRPAYWRMQLGPFVLVRFDAPWED